MPPPLAARLRGARRRAALDVRGVPETVPRSETFEDAARAHADERTTTHPAHSCQSTGGTRRTAAAARAQKAGYDGVQVHGAHGYILAQFISPKYNRRDDEYGGDLAGRTRIVWEVIEGIRQTCGADFLLSIRLSPERLLSRVTHCRFDGSAAGALSVPHEFLPIHTILPSRCVQPTMATA